MSSTPAAERSPSCRVDWKLAGVRIERTRPKKGRLPRSRGGPRSEAERRRRNAGERTRKTAPTPRGTARTPKRTEPTPPSAKRKRRSGSWRASGHGLRVRSPAARVLGLEAAVSGRDRCPSTRTFAAIRGHGRASRNGGLRAERTGSPCATSPWVSKPPALREIGVPRYLAPSQWRPRALGALRLGRAA